VVFFLEQRQSEKSESRIRPEFAIWLHGYKLVQRGTARADYEPADSENGICLSRGILGAKPLVNVIVAIQYDVDLRIVKQLP
jgi:hypothetical protein